MLLTILLAAASAGVLVSGQGFPAPAPAGCTALSFAIPSWFVTDLEVTYSTSSSYNTTRKATFTINNRATNYTADLTCLVASTGTSDCTVADTMPSGNAVLASVQLTATHAGVFLNQTWTCSDRAGSKLAPFVAYGNATVALSNGKAIDSPLLIQGSLSSPVAINPIRAWGPTGHANPGCSAPENSKWALNVPFYANQTGDGVDNVASQEFSVLVINTATGYEASCMSGAGFGDGLTPTPATGPLTLVCAGTEFQSSGGGRYSITTAASFDPYTYRFEVNQTWFCDAENPARPIQITASASEILPLTCTSSQIGNPDNGPRDTRYSCIHYDDVVVSGKHVTETALPAYSIEDPVPGADDCTLSSIFHPQWTFSTFEVDSDATIPQSVSFEIILRTGSPGFQFPIAIYQGAAAAGEEGWYDCVIGPSGDIGEVLWPSSCSFKYVAATKELSLKADWACGEYDPDHPILFSGVTTTAVDSALVCDTFEGVTMCFTEDGAYQWTADIENVAWRQ